MSLLSAPTVLNIKAVFVAAVVGLLAGALAAWVVQGWRIDAIEAAFVTEKAEAIEKEQKRADQIASDYADVVRWLNEQKQARTVTLIKELEKPIYRDAACVLPESGRVLVNDAVRQANAARIGRSVLPEGAGIAGKIDDGRSVDVVGMAGRGIRGMLGRESQVDQVGDGVGHD